MANTEATFYLMEFAKAAAPASAIALVLVATFSLRRIASSRMLLALQLITALWSLATMLRGAAISSPAQHHWLSGHIATEEEHRALMDSYFHTISALYAAEQALLFAFAIALFLVLRQVAARQRV